MSEDTQSTSFITQLKKTKDRAYTVWAVMGGLFLLGLHTANFVKQVATTAYVDEVRSFVITENAKQDANIQANKDRNQANADKIQDNRKMLSRLLEDYAADLAYKKASPRSKANAASARARVRFKKALYEGRTLEQAFEASQEGLNYWAFSRDDE